MGADSWRRAQAEYPLLDTSNCLHKKAMGKWAFCEGMNAHFTSSPP